MSAAQIVRSIQLRSVEQYIFDPLYNRVSFNVEPDGLSTDMSQSYLKLRLSLTDIGTKANRTAPVLLTQTDFDAFIAKNVVVSFGHEGMAYSPACLISLARLRAKGTGEILEEIQFANVLSQTLFQLCNDFETLGASNLQTGSAVQLSGHGSDLMSALSCFLQPNTEIQIMLRDIFGLCRHTNFDLSKVGGLIFEVELEQTHNLFQVTTGYNERAIDASGHTILPEASGNFLLFGQTPESNAQTFLTAGALATNAGKRPAFNNLMINPALNGGELIQVPRDGFFFDGNLFADIQTAFAADSNQYILKFKLAADGGRDFTTAQLGFCKLVAGNDVKLTFIMTEIATGTEKPFVGISAIQSVSDTNGATPAEITLAESFYYNTQAWSGYSVRLALLEILETPAGNGTGILPFEPIDVLEYVANEGLGQDLNAFVTGNTIKLSISQLEVLSKMGVLDVSGAGIYVPTQNSFDLSVQTRDVSGVIITYDRVVNEGTNSRRVLSNQLTKMSAAGEKTYIDSVGALDASGCAIVTFGNFFLNTTQGYQLGKGVLPNPDFNMDMVQYSILTPSAPSYNVYFTNCQQPKTPINERQYSYSIDQFQLVLVQETMTMPMTPAYSSFSVEVAAIESDQQQYSRQFILTAANTYNGLFMIPDYLTNAGGSLVATARGLANYRISVNNVANTNRVVTIQDVTSQSPASLQFDKLMTTFQNSEYNLRNFTGIKTTTDSHSPVIVLPIKIYSGVVNGTYQYAPQTMSATIQLDLYGSPKTIDDTIYKGPIFFFKQSIRNIATGMGQVV